MNGISCSPVTVDELADSDRRWREARAAANKAEEDNSLKDQFAAAALSGILSCELDYDGHKDKVTRSALAWDYAEQMMKERAERAKKRGPQ